VGVGVALAGLGDFGFDAIYGILMSMRFRTKLFKKSIL
jgi:hypothetical protein